MLRRLPFALSVLPSLEVLIFADSWDFSEPVSQVSDSIRYALEGIANSRLVGGLRKLRFIGLGGHTHCPMHRLNQKYRLTQKQPVHLLPDSVFRVQCFCPTLRQCWPVDSLFELSWSNGGIHNFCGDAIEFCKGAIQQGLDLNAPTRLYADRMSHTCSSFRDAVLFVRLRDLSELFLDSPTNFELAVVMHLVLLGNGLDTVHVIDYLWRQGGVVGVALRDAIRSGRLRTFLEKSTLTRSEKSFAAMSFLMHSLASDDNSVADMRMLIEALP
jgi:hypothetical protein